MGDEWDHRSSHEDLPTFSLGCYRVRMTNKRGQYWTADQGRALVQRWNKHNDLPKATWNEDTHARFLESANLVDGAEHVFIAIEGHGEYPLAPFLFVAEQYHAPLAQSTIFKAEHDADARWVERLAVRLIEMLDLDLSFEVVELIDGEMRVVRSTRQSSS